MRFVLFTVLILAGSPVSAGGVEFADDKHGTLHIAVEGIVFADYVYHDDDIPRPYFKSVDAPNGTQLTRNQPPNSEQDIADHPLFHPGIWLSFGDLNGSDYWRLAAKMKFAGFEQSPQATESGGEFAARFEYLDQQDPKLVVCEERFNCKIVFHPAGTLILWDSAFSGPNTFYFGDQEEMGLGIRMATPLRSERQPHGTIPPGNGTILDAEGRKNGGEVWGHAARWCDYSGTLDGSRAGMTIFCHPENFRPSWFHARDYGLLVANAFGRQAFKQGDPSKIVVKPGDELHLRYGILLHAGNPCDFDSVYKDYLALTAD